MSEDDLLAGVRSAPAAEQLGGVSGPMDPSPAPSSETTAGWYHPSGSSPRRVRLICLGPSSSHFMMLALTKGIPPSAEQLGTRRYFDETWTVNRGIRCFPHDVAFVLDDLRSEAAQDPDYGECLRFHDRPIITSTPYPEFPTAAGYPLAQVMDRLGPVHQDYLHNSVPLVIAYAQLLGVQELVIYGADYSHPRSSAHEDDRANAEYFIAWARCMGMRIGVPADSTLLSRHRGLHLYGWLYPPPAYYERVRGW